MDAKSGDNRVRDVKSTLKNAPNRPDNDWNERSSEHGAGFSVAADKRMTNGFGTLQLGSACRRPSLPGNRLIKRELRGGLDEQIPILRWQGSIVPG